MTEKSGCSCYSSFFSYSNCSQCTQKKKKKEKKATNQALCVCLWEKGQKPVLQQCCSLGIFQIIFQEGFDSFLCKHYTVKSAACPRRGAESPGSAQGAGIPREQRWFKCSNFESWILGCSWLHWLLASPSLDTLGTNPPEPGSMKKLQIPTEV